MSASLRYFGAVLVILLGAWLGARFYLARHGQETVSVPAGVAGMSDPKKDATVQTVAGPIPVIPEKLPDFSLKDLAGKPTSVSSWKGKSLMINFWATWCAPCRREIPLLKTLASDWSARNLTVVGVAVDYPDKVRDFADRFKIDYPVLIGEQDALDVAAQLGMASPVFPFTVFTDRRGEVVALFVGELHRPQADFILSQVQSLDQDRVRLPEARRTISKGLRDMADKAG